MINQFGILRERKSKILAVMQVVITPTIKSDLVALPRLLLEVIAPLEVYQLHNLS